jgi:hypothetical protein
VGSAQLHNSAQARNAPRWQKAEFHLARDRPPRHPARDAAKAAELARFEERCVNSPDAAHIRRRAQPATSFTE